MISIVICSIRPELLAELKSNIKRTIGVSYEVIAIDNRLDSKGICQVYNEGLKKANFNIVCFCHEDILFETRDWGKILSALVTTNKEIGLVGIAGAVYKSKYPGSWTAVPYKYYRINMIQEKKDGTSADHVLHDRGNFSEVAVIDGCFIAGRKELFEQYKWNEKLLKNFHLYDLDISIRVGQQYKIVVSNNIKITHFSEGEFNKVWLEDARKFHQHYQNVLPVNRVALEKQEQKELEYFALNNYVLTLIKLRQPVLRIVSIIMNGVILFPLRKQNLSLLRRLAGNL